MITLEGESITYTDPHRHKFDSALTEYIYVTALARGLLDTWTGGHEAPMGSVSLHGRRLMFCDDRGFVYTDTYPEVDAARAVYDAIDLWYYTWEETDLDDEDEGHEPIEVAEAYCAYVIACATENLTAYDMQSWKIRDCPKGPLG